MKIPTQVQTAWVGGTTPLPPFAVEVTAPEPPAGLTFAVAGLWWDDKGDWTRAHGKEGDQDNAAYWYRRAGKPVCREPLDAEWLSIARDLLG